MLLKIGLKSHLNISLISFLLLSSNEISAFQNIAHNVGRGVNRAITMDWIYNMPLFAINKLRNAKSEAASMMLIIRFLSERCFLSQTAKLNRLSKHPYMIAVYNTVAPHKIPRNRKLITVNTTRYLPA
ncbi:hypothetical protein SDC9_72729 [bioreactor metagenome]|uniref:Uncharacterized protein n=1 Tax=bioreactor metagenome TaxID=1076179 RepID=A0A644YE42_9ZZZZ